MELKGDDNMDEIQKEINLRNMFYIQTLRDILIKNGITTAGEFIDTFEREVNDCKMIDAETKKKLLFREP